VEKYRGARLTLGAEVALASACGFCFFALLAVPLAVAESRLLPVLFLGVAGVAALIAVLRFGGIVYAVPAAVGGLLAFDWFYIPPPHPRAVPDTQSFIDLLVFLAVGVLIGELAARAGRRAASSELARRELADEQTALRRVATLVAQGASPPDVFAAVTEEVGRLLPVDMALMGRYESDGTAIAIGAWGAPVAHFAVGTRWSLEGKNVSTEVAKTGRPVRIDHYDDASGMIGDIGRESGFRSAVGTPIVVEGCLWGVMVVGSTRSEPPLPAGTEARLAQFTELLATAVANAENRAELARLAEEQAALRRVATLVARGTPPEQLFAAVAKEVGQLLCVDYAGLNRFESDGKTMTIVSVWGKAGEPVPPGGNRQVLGGKNVSTVVFETGAAARIDGYGDSSGSLGLAAREYGIASGVGIPVVVEGHLWGAITVYSGPGQPLSADTEARLAGFSGLVATAVANAQSGAALAASRARIVSAADDERRQVVRDLHDGAQQRLVHTVVTLQMASRALENKREDVPALLHEALGNAELATDELRELAHGIMPSILTRGGLRAGVDALAARMPVPVETGVSVDRLPPAIEATAYFILAEALTNVVKHSHAEHAEVTARLENGMLRLQVRDDGIGGARTDGTGLVGLADRVAALDGSLRLESSDGAGTLVAADIPVRQAA
jgi:signal transduction histidine kinase